MTYPIAIWLSFLFLIFALLAFDLGVLHRKAHTIKMREAVLLSIFWISLAVIFNIIVYFWLGGDKAGEFLTGYIVEKSLSVDNLFVFIIIFSYFKVNTDYQHRILFYGILGALITRGIFIFAGVTIIEAFHPILYLFGLFLIWTAYKLTKNDDDDKVNPEENFVVKYLSRYLPVSGMNNGSNFFIKNYKGRLLVTSLFIVLLVIETTDVMFAFDSVPAVLSITQDPFIVYSSNVFAILGLRALYFVLARIMPAFYYLNYGLAIVLGFIGVKMLISGFYVIPISASLGTVIVVLGTSVLASVIRTQRMKKDGIIETIEV